MSTYLAQLRGEVSQGDIFDNLPTVYVQHADLTLKVQIARAMLLTHDCEYDKPRSPTVIVAEVWPLADIDPGSREIIRKNRVLSAFYLEAYGTSFPESYVDLRNISRLEKSIIVEYAQAGARMLSLSDEARLALQRQMALFLGLDR